MRIVIGIEVLGENLPSATLQTINFTYLDLGSNLGFSRWEAYD
jgi:hypothetical protein